MPSVIDSNRSHLTIEPSRVCVARRRWLSGVEPCESGLIASGTGLRILACGPSDAERSSFGQTLGRFKRSLKLKAAGGECDMDDEDDTAAC